MRLLCLAVKEQRVGKEFYDCILITGSSWSLNEAIGLLPTQLTNWCGAEIVIRTAVRWIFALAIRYKGTPPIRPLFGIFQARVFYALDIFV